MSMLGHLGLDRNLINYVGAIQFASWISSFTGKLTSTTQSYCRSDWSKPISMFFIEKVFELWKHQSALLSKFCVLSRLFIHPMPFKLFPPHNPTVNRYILSRIFDVFRMRLHEIRLMARFHGDELCILILPGAFAKTLLESRPRGVCSGKNIQNTNHFFMPAKRIAIA